MQKHYSVEKISALVDEVFRIEELGAPSSILEVVPSGPQMENFFIPRWMLKFLMGYVVCLLVILDPFRRRMRLLFLVKVKDLVF